MVNVVWRRSGCDKQVHAFSLAQIASGRSYLEAVCEHIVPPAVLEPVLRPGPDTCRPCLSVLGNRLADAGGGPGRYRTAHPRPGRPSAFLPPSPAAGQLHCPWAEFGGEPLTARPTGARAPG